MSKDVLVIKSAAIAAYGFGDGHPFGPDRHDVLHARLAEDGIADQVRLAEGRTATRKEIELFHTAAYVDQVIEQCTEGYGYLDGGDTPAMAGLYESTSAVVGATLYAADELMGGAAHHAFVPIAGLHHAARDRAAGFCVFNDCGVVIEYLRQQHGLKRIAYIDIDAHHGDGVFYAFEDDPDVGFADIHEDGRFLYPGTGAATETGKGEAQGTKLNIPVPPRADDEVFMEVWAEVEAYLMEFEPEFILFHCGADSLAGDPIT
ncbi:MAG: acetoin utilization protein AcuC, partial [Gammaproteobacteria bacterium]